MLVGGPIQTWEGMGPNLGVLMGNWQISQIDFDKTYFSVLPSARSCIYASYLLPVTLPQEKQRTGIIMIVVVM